MDIGIVGTGMIVKEVLPQLKDCGWNVIALCGTERSSDKVNDICREFKIEYAYTEYEKFLANSEIGTIYLGIPNFLHYDFAKRALLAGKNVIVEKPMTSNVEEAQELMELAKEKKLYLFEAITTLYLPVYHQIQKWLPQIGEIKMVTCNFSQYSSRYDKFKAGEVLPVFDPNKSGGALMDLNLYNLHWLLGLFGEPEVVEYKPNIERNIDTSGILYLEYPTFHAISIAAKDSASPANYVIQGTKGYIHQSTPANSTSQATLHLNDGRVESVGSDSLEEVKNRLVPEFDYFMEEIKSENRTNCYEKLEHSVRVSKVQTEARRKAGIIFPADRRTI